MSQYTQDTFHHNQNREIAPETRATPEMHYDSGQTKCTLATRLRGELILPQDPGYQAACEVWNGTADRRPAMIARCADVADVVTAVQFAREHHMVVSVRSGGHSFAGYGTNDGGLVIDLSLMKAITVDQERRIARIEPGLTWGEVATILQPTGLALTSGDTSSVGVGGLLLGGGIGWMARKYGLTIDRLRAVELVTAAGEILRASTDDLAELFWGLRGGGGNFGVAVAFEVDLHPGGMVLGGAILYDATEAESILQAYSRSVTAAPDELTTGAALMTAPPVPFIPPDKQGTPCVAILLCYTGDLAEGERVVAPLRQLATPIADVISPMPYPAMFALTEMDMARGLQHTVRSIFVRVLSDEVIHTIVEEAAAIMFPLTMVQVRVLGGAMSRVSADATAFAHRRQQALLTVSNVALAATDIVQAQARTEQFWQTLQPYADGAYVNFLCDEGEQRIHEAYPPATFARLAALKKRYDPTNLFHLNQNILPM